MDNSIRKQLLYRMILIREFENAVTVCKDNRQIYGGTHCCNGEEAIAVGTCMALNRDDYIVSNHRPHGHALAKGGDPDRIMAEMFGKMNGTNSGKGGSMHIHDAGVGHIASTGIVGSGIPIGCGAGFAAKYENKGRISAVFFGDGAANEGVLHESLNLAAAWGLPVLFVLEDNGLAITTQTKESSACHDYVKFASSYGIEGTHVDGQNVEEVFDKVSEAAAYIRNESKPFFIHAHTIRFNEHAEGDYYKRMIEKNYRDYSVLEMEKRDKCPVKMYISRLKSEGVLTDHEVEEMYDQVKKTIDHSIDYAVSSPEPEPESAFTDVFMGE